MLDGPNDCAAERITAYTGPTGPAYTIAFEQPDPFAHQRRCAPTLDALDRLLDETPLADCRAAFEGAWEYTCRAGVLREHHLRGE
jgi:hypothetical protein